MPQVSCVGESFTDGFKIFGSHISVHRRLSFTQRGGFSLNSFSYLRTGPCFSVRRPVEKVIALLRIVIVGVLLCIAFIMRILIKISLHILRNNRFQTLSN